jgi:hypothetical protein
MDLRLIDNIVVFMSHDNLTNSYDQFILAGASLGHFAETNRDDYTAKAWKNHLDWRKALADHIQLAIDLHDVGDVYIMEHRCCGAYKHFLRHPPDTTDASGEAHAHKKYADSFMKYIQRKHSALHVHSFLMDLRGNVELLNTTNPE